MSLTLQQLLLTLQQPGLYTVRTNMNQSLRLLSLFRQHAAKANLENCGMMQKETNQKGRVEQKKFNFVLFLQHYFCTVKRETEGIAGFSRASVPGPLEGVPNVQVGVHT